MKYIAFLLAVFLLGCKSNSIEPNQDIHSPDERAEEVILDDAVDDN
ncbi:MAG: hypothetical protein L3J82_05175 [Planctomycetes bacterium]|nr:hypothetical protein [Planctomycetota bacterium]